MEAGMPVPTVGDQPSTTGKNSRRPTAEQRRIEDVLVRENLPLVGYLVNEALAKVPSHVRREDLTAAGMAGLALAARSFEEERGVPFARFATLRIRGSIVDELRSQDWASRGVRAKARTREQAIDSLTASLGRPPTPAETADALGISVASLQADEQDLHRAVVLSISVPNETGEDGGPTGTDALLPADTRTPESEILEREQRAYLYDAVACLPERLRTVVVGYFLDDRPMAELAAELGVTESRVSQMRGEAVTLLRESMRTHLDARTVAERPVEGLVARRREAYFAAVATRSDYRSRISARQPYGVPAQAEALPDAVVRSA
jgi:RNA polymerase sigma factor for flagellar operon FliA